jgi:hypothetical protein
VTPHTQVKATQAITRQTVTTTLQDHSLWAVPLHDALDNGLEDTLVGNVVDTIAQREIDSVVFAGADANIAKFTSTRKVLAVLVKGYGHNAIGCVKCLLDTITMMDINVDIKNSLLESQKLKDSENNI